MKKKDKKSKRNEANINEIDYKSQREKERERERERTHFKHLSSLSIYNISFEIPSIVVYYAFNDCFI